jgi:hypothetical protein
MGGWGMPSSSLGVTWAAYLSFFLMDYILRVGGYMILVMPGINVLHKPG